MVVSDVGTKKPVKPSVVNWDQNIDKFKRYGAVHLGAGVA